MKTPRQWINTRQKEDPKRLDLNECSVHVTKIVNGK